MFHFIFVYEANEEIERQHFLTSEMFEMLKQFTARSKRFFFSSSDLGLNVAYHFVM